MNERTFKYKDKEYKESELSATVVNWFLLKQELLQSLPHFSRIFCGIFSTENKNQIYLT